MHRFTFDGKSSDELKLIVQSLGRRKRGDQDIDVLEVPYSNRSVTVSYDFYRPYERPMRVAVRSYQDLKYAYAHLKGYARLETSMDDDVYFMAYVDSIGEPERIACDVFSFEISFVVDPLAFLLSGEATQTVASGDILENPGTHEAYPLLKIFGTGGDVSVGDKIISFSAIDEFVIVDSYRKIVYKDTLNKGQTMTGDFPVLNPGSNAITFGTGITAVEVTPRWCER